MVRRWLARFGWVLLSGLLVALIGLVTWEPFFAEEGSSPPEGQYRAEIIRDDFGVPHISGKRDADVAYGVAWAHAEDDFFTLQDVAAMTRGRYAAIAGKEGAQFDYAYHLLGARKTAERDYAKLPADTRAVVDAYAAGLNDYAAKHPQEVKLARLFPINGVDIAAGFALRQPFFFGLGQTLGPLAEGELPAPDQGPALNTPLPTPEEGETLGSNAWAIAPARYENDTTLLISNSHQPLRGGVAWYELTVESEEGWHFTGATFPGSPYPFLGHNENLGWTNTVNTPDMIDTYELVLDDSGERYKLDGEWRDLESEDVWLRVKFGPLVLPVKQTVYRSVHGPVIKNDRGAFALRYGGMDSIDQLDAYYRINKATNYDEWRTIMARQQIPSTNFIYADREGNIAHIYNASIPQRQAGPDWRNVLPGDDSSLIWDSLVDYDALPQYKNPASGYVWNANNQPFFAAGPGSNLKAEDFAPEMGIELRMTNRAYRAAKLMREVEGRFTRETIDRIKYDTVYDREGYIATAMDAVEALNLSDAPKLAEAQKLLAEWDMDFDNKGPGDAVALIVLSRPMATSYWMKEAPDAREVLTEAVDHLMTHFGRLDVPLSDLLRLRQGDVDLPLIGGSDTLRASTFWEVHEDGRFSLRHGDSFIQYVEWRPGQRVFSESIQPFGAATTRPGSPHYTDQMQLYVDQKLKPVNFWRDVAEKAAKRRYWVESN